jgi:phospholipase D3/4
MKGGYVQAEFMDFIAMGKSEGVFHTKFMVADGSGTYVSVNNLGCRVSYTARALDVRHAAVFIGSANMDYRSFTQVKELSLYFPDCPDVAGDMETQFEIYWSIAQTNKVPSSWPDSFAPLGNASSPGVTVMNGSSAQFYYSTSPPFLRPPGWTPDENAIATAIFAANTTVNVSMMDYVPAQLYATPNTYWNTIDDCIRVANFKYVVASEC